MLDGPLVFVDDLDAPVLAEDDRHHLERVLRLRPGSALSASDGAGRWRPCRLGSLLEPVGDIVVEPPPARPLTVAFALVKGERPELVVQKLTELGIDRIIPFAAARSVVRWDEAKGARQAERLRTVARAAAMQCLRPRLPEVGEPTTFADVSALDGAAMADRGGDSPDLDHPVTLIGPEGGWDEGERSSGLPVVQFAQNILRAETAAIAAAAVMAALRAQIVGQHHAR